MKSGALVRSCVAFGFLTGCAQQAPEQAAAPDREVVAAPSRPVVVERFDLDAYLTEVGRGLWTVDNVHRALEKPSLGAIAVAEDGTRHRPLSKDDNPSRTGIHNRRACTRFQRTAI